MHQRPCAIGRLKAVCMFHHAIGTWACYVVKHANKLCWPRNVTTVMFTPTPVHEAVHLVYHGLHGS